MKASVPRQSRVLPSYVAVRVSKDRRRTNIAETARVTSEYEASGN